MITIMDIISIFDFIDPPGRQGLTLDIKIIQCGISLYKGIFLYYIIIGFIVVGGRKKIFDDIFATCYACIIISVRNTD